jgi:hypothetical protein
VCTLHFRKTGSSSETRRMIIEEKNSKVLNGGLHENKIETGKAVHSSFFLLRRGGIQVLKSLLDYNFVAT